MGSLNNLYISQSFQSLIHLGNDWTASSDYQELEDGLGNGIGISVNTLGDLHVSSSITASTLFSNTISASNLFVSGTISAYEINVTIQSSSIIFTSGSNIIGDEANVDTQTLVGRVIVTGSLEVTGSTKMGSLEQSGITSFTELTGSLAEYSASVDSRVYALEEWSTSVQISTVTQAELNASSSTLQGNIDRKLDTASFNSYTSSISSSNSLVSQSFVTTIINLSSSISGTINILSTSVDSRLDVIESKYATTGSNTFVGNQTITGSLSVSGSMVYSGSVRGEVNVLTIASQTASIDCSRGNFFTLTLVSGSNTFINATNINPGETISLKIKQPSVLFGTVTFSSAFKFPINFPYIATPLQNTEDIISMVSYDTNALYATAVNSLT
jgi:hypothetical protein